MKNLFFSSLAIGLILEQGCVCQDAESRQVSPGRTSAIATEIRRRALLTNTATYRLARPGNPWGYVPTNTLAFQEHALDVLLAQANFFNEKLQLGTPKPISEGHVTEFMAIAKTNGINGRIEILDRYSFGVSESRLQTFRDSANWSSAFYGKAEKLKSLLKLTNSLSSETALRLARNALHKLGLNEETLRLREPPQVTQWDYVPTGETNVYLTPIYDIEWRFKVPLGTPTNLAAIAIQLEVSGVTSNVVSFYNVSREALKIPLPTNYFEILGLHPRLFENNAKVPRLRQ